MTLVFVDDLDAPQLGEGDRHHLERVLRIKRDEEIVASDGIGGHRPCRLGVGGRLDPVGPVGRDPAPSPALDRPEGNCVFATGHLMRAMIVPCVGAMNRGSIRKTLAC